MGVVSRRLRASAKGQQCTLRAVRTCTGIDTTVLCHAPGPKSAASKGDDWWAAFGCAACHQAMDLHRYEHIVETKIWLRGIRETQRIWYERGLLVVPETKKRKPKSTKTLPPRSIYARGRLLSPSKSEDID